MYKTYHKKKITYMDLVFIYVIFIGGDEFYFSLFGMV